MIKFSKTVSAMILALGIAGSASAAYPDEQPVKVLVGYTPGGTTDLVARIVAKGLSDELKQSFVVENKPGASNNIAMTEVARAKPNGYTLIVTTIASSVNATLFKKLNYDLKKDFAPVALIAKVPNVMVVNPKLPVNNMKELVEYIKNNKDKATYASSGIGSSQFLCGEQLNQDAGTQILHVPFKGSAPGLTAVMAGDVLMECDNMPSAWPFISAGKLKALAVTSKEKSAVAPKLPTMMEEGFKDFDISSWFGVLAPAGMPKEDVALLNKAILKVVAKPDVQKQLADQGAIPQDMTPEQFGSFISDEVDRWGALITKLGVSAN